jgi:hypothetical protein
MAIVSNVIFIAYGALANVLPILILHAILLPLNAYRLREMLQLVARIRKAAGGEAAHAEPSDAKPERPVLH